MFRKPVILMFACAIGSAANGAPILNGMWDAAYGDAAAVQSVETQFGDNDNELNAAYATVEGGALYLLLTGNLANNFNKLNIFFDSQAGGQNILESDGNSGGTNPENDSWANKHAGMTFDAGFEADFLLTLRNGPSPGASFDVDYAVVGGGLGNFLSATDIFSGSLEGSNASALSNNIGVAFDNSNVGGILGGTGAANPLAAQAVTTGIELFIPLAAIGNPVGTINISAMLNGSNHDFLSNQFLGGLPAGTGNLGGDGNGVFTGSLSQVDLNEFAGNQYFGVLAPRLEPVPEPGTLMLLSIGISGLVLRRSRRDRTQDSCRSRFSLASA